MSNDNFIRNEFVSRTLRQGIDKIFSLQRERLADGIRNRSYRLRNFLYHPAYSVSTDPIVNVVVNYPIQIRFLDMKRQGNHRIYNRPLWGVVYREIIPELMYGYTNEARYRIYNEIMAAFGADEKRRIKI